MFYVIRKSWRDERSEIGKVRKLIDAKKIADANDKYYVFNSSGKKIYPKTVNKQKTTKCVAREVLSGKWEDAEERRKFIKKAGYDYRAVQNMVGTMVRHHMNLTIHDIAQEVVEGKWGEGEILHQLLEKAGYDYKDVMREIERLDKEGGDIDDFI